MRLFQESARAYSTSRSPEAQRMQHNKHTHTQNGMHMQFTSQISAGGTLRKQLRPDGHLSGQRRAHNKGRQ